MIVTILGPDGSGKTTLATELAKEVNSISYVYFGGSNESRKYRYFEEFIKSDLSNIFLRIFRKILRVINDFDVYSQSKKNHVISDRCPIDNYIITKVQGRKIRHYYYFILLISPSPDFVILLNGDAEIIYKRKEELSVSEIQKYVQYYQDYLNDKRIKYCTIDTVKNNIEKCLIIAKSELNSRLS